MKKVLVIGGPTATGKSDLAVELATIFDGEVVNADSVQIYRGMDIGTAKPPLEVRKRVSHHLFDVATIDAPWDVKRYEKEAVEVVEGILGRGKLPIVVGGSGFYIDGLLYGVPEAPGSDESLRRILSKCSDGLLRFVLERVDAERASKIHPSDRKRLLRAVEIYLLTGAPPSRFEWERGLERWDTLKIALDLPRDELKERIYKRVDDMMARGWLDEVRALVKEYGMDNRLLNETLGYRELVQFLKGEVGLEEAVDRIKRATYRYSKRQRTWFKGRGFTFYDARKKQEILEAVKRWLDD